MAMQIRNSTPLKSSYNQEHKLNWATSTLTNEQKPLAAVSYSTHTKLLQRPG